MQRNKHKGKHEEKMMKKSMKDETQIVKKNPENLIEYNERRNEGGNENIETTSKCGW